MGGPRRTSKEPGILDRVAFLGHRIVRKIELDDHTDLFELTRAGRRRVGLRMSQGGDIRYWLREANEAINLAECVLDILGASGPEREHPAHADGTTGSGTGQADE